MSDAIRPHAPRPLRLLRSGAIPITVAMVTLAGAAWLELAGLDRMGAQSVHIVNENLEAAAGITAIEARASALSGLPYRLVAMAEAGIGGPAQSGLAQAGAQAAALAGALRAWRDRFATPQQIRPLNQAADALLAYQLALQDMAARPAQDLAATVGFLEPYDALIDNLTGLLRRLAQDTVADARARSAQATAHAAETGHYLLALTLVIAVSIAVLSWRFGKRRHSLLLTRETLRREVAERTRELEIARSEAEAALAEAQKARRELMLAEQMAALGGLVAGVAHEINTPVGTALTAVTLLEERTRHFRALVESGQLRKADLARYLDMASETAALTLSNIQRAAALIQSFKQVAVDQTSDERRRFDLAAYVSEVVTSLTPQLRKSAATVALEIPEGIEMDSFPGALSQVVTNFIMNALTHAFAPGQEKAAEIRISAAARGDGLDLVVADNGRGMAAEILARIFEPFFTTRRGEGGTGLGLHIVYNLVTQRLGGTIDAQSTPGAGTRFTVGLPVVAPGG